MTVPIFVDKRELRMVRYEEKQLCKWALLFLIIIVFIIYAHITFSNPYWVSHLFFPILEVFFTIIFVNFLYLRIKIDGKYLVFGFGMIRNKILLDKIISCEETEIKFSNHLGYGIRLGRDGSIAYIIRSGKGIRLKIKGKKREYVVSTDNADKICEILKQQEMIS